MMKLSVLTLSILTLTGCASVDLKKSIETTQTQIKPVHSSQWSYIQTQEQKNNMQQRSHALLSKVLDQNQAVELMLIHSPQFQALLAEHWKRMNQAAQYGRIANPTFSFERMTTVHELEIGRMFTFGLLDVLSIPSRTESAELAISKTQLNLSNQVLKQIKAVQLAWIDAVQAQESLALAKKVEDSLEATADLAERMQKVGNFNRYQTIQQQMLHSGSLVSLANAQHTALSSKEKLVRLLGLTAEESSQLKLPTQLPDLPSTTIRANQVSELATNRLDIQIAKLNYQSLLKKHGYESVASFIDIEGSVINNSVSNSETGESERPRGYEIELKVPLFDWGDLKREALQAELKASSNQFEQTLRSASSHLRESYSRYRTSLDIAKHFKDEVLPMQALINEENTYRYNGMFIGVFEWMSEQRKQIAVYENAIQSKANFWKSHVDLNANILGQTDEIQLSSINANTSSETGGH